MALTGKSLGTSMQHFFLYYWVLSPSVQPHNLTWSISRHISVTVLLTILSAVSQCTRSCPYLVNLYAHLCNCVSYINECWFPVYSLMTLTGQSLCTFLQLCFLQYRVESLSVQPHYLTWSISRHIFATVFLTLLSARPSVNLMTLPGQSIGSFLQLYFLSYWVMSPSVQPHDLTRSFSRNMSATVLLTLLSAVSQCKSHVLTRLICRHIFADVFLTLLSAVSQCTTSWPYPDNL
jgi:hypothetical protein